MNLDDLENIRVVRTRFEVEQINPVSQFFFEFVCSLPHQKWLMPMRWHFRDDSPWKMVFGLKYPDSPTVC